MYAPLKRIPLAAGQSCGQMPFRHRSFASRPFSRFANRTLLYL
nr:MAG TPA: hypothetical protein [Inoviridae sp.]